MPADPHLTEPEREGAEPEPDEVLELDGPDPRLWPSDPDLWPLIEDIEVTRRVIEAMQGSSAKRAGAAYDHVLGLLEHLLDEARGQFALALVQAYGMKVPEAPATSMFESAGKPRAYGAAPRPPGRGPDDPPDAMT